MNKTPGRKTQISPFKKTQLSSDAKIIAALLKKQPQTKESICKETKISDSSFYRNIPLLEKTKLIKQIDQIYALWDFDVLEERIEAALSKLIKENPILHFSHVVNEIGKPWHEIEDATFKIAKKLELTIMIEEGVQFSMEKLQVEHAITQNKKRLKNNQFKKTNPKQPHPTQPTPPKLQLFCKPNHRLNTNLSRYLLGHLCVLNE